MDNKEVQKDKIEECNCTIIHSDVVNKLRKDLLKDELFYDLAELFKVFGDCTRIKIIWALFESEMCVCDIAALFNITHSAASHQLRTLKNARLVKYRRSGKVVYYSLDDDHIKKILDQGLSHITEEK